MEFSPRVKAYSDDAAHLGELLGMYRSECLDYLEGRREFLEGYDNAKGWERKLDDGRYCLTQFPHGHADTARSLMAPALANLSNQTGASIDEGQSRELYFVGFFGQKRTSLKPDLTSQMDKLNRSLMAVLCDQPDIYLYGTAHLTRGNDFNDYYNMVVLQHEEASHNWRDNVLHAREAVDNLSPKYYTTVRIHTGVLPDGLNSKEFLLKRSVFLDYRDHQKDPSAPIHREEKLWTN